MDLAGIREAVRSQPFRPFSLKMADGRSLPVPYPGFVAVGRRHAIVIAEDDSWSVVEPLLVVSLDYATSPHPSGSEPPAGDGQ